MKKILKNPSYGGHGGAQKGPNDLKQTSCWNIQVIHDYDSETYLGPCKQTCKFMEVPLINQPSHQCLFRISLWVGRASCSWLRISSETGETGISSEPGETGRSFGLKDQDAKKLDSSCFPDSQFLLLHCMFWYLKAYMPHIDAAYKES